MGFVAWCIGEFHTQRVYWSQQINLQNFQCHISCSWNDEFAPKWICSWLSNHCGVTAILGSVDRCAISIKREIMVSLVIKINRALEGPWLSRRLFLPKSVLWRRWKNRCASLQGSEMKKLKLTKVLRNGWRKEEPLHLSQKAGVVIVSDQAEWVLWVSWGMVF